MNNKVILKDAFKGYTVDQDKIVSPEQTVLRFREKLKQVDLDILERTVRIDNGRLDIPVYFSVCGKDAEEVIGTKKVINKKYVLSGVLGLFMLVTGFGMLSGNWQNNISKEEYINLYKEIDSYGHPTGTESVKRFNEHAIEKERKKESKDLEALK